MSCSRSRAKPASALLHLGGLAFELLFRRLCPGALFVALRLKRRTLFPLALQLCREAGRIRLALERREPERCAAAADGEEQKHDVKRIECHGPDCMFFICSWQRAIGWQIAGTLWRFC